VEKKLNAECGMGGGKKKILFRFVVKDEDSSLGYLGRGSAEKERHCFREPQSCMVFLFIDKYFIDIYIYTRSLVLD
jgi:hypothetical protein